ncbi:hydroxyacid dehydrogenase [Cytobacillus sp. FSL K6-0265]|uniref:hydroxyacid dehydrogenase n=1 Tax=Cytobacillus sp. FSL K6-0265 TaxID=2921448 RepID=UPI0030FA26A5
MKIFLNEYIHPTAVDKLKKHAEIVSDFKNAEEIDAIILRTTNVSREIIEKASNLKVIGKHGVGYDTIDINAAKDYGVKVVYTPKANVQSVAELIVALMTNVARNTSIAFEKVRKSEVKTIAPKELIGVELQGKTLGLVGIGNIALGAADILKNGYKMKVIGYDPYVSEEKCQDLGINKCENLEAMLGEADFINISVPLTDSTRKMIDLEKLKCCKPNAIIVNTARGGVIDEEALYYALKTGIIRAAASDVFIQEPPTAENPLTQLDNFVPTPHLGACTEEAMIRMGMTVVDEVLAVLKGEEPRYPVV